MSKGWHFRVDGKIDYRTDDYIRGEKVDIALAEVEKLIGEKRLHEIPWTWESSPVTLVKKQGGRWRLCVDFKRVNQQVHSPRFNMVGKKAIIKYAKQFKYFVKTDLKNGYHNIPIHPKCKKFLNFRVGNRCFQYDYLPFGLNKAPYIFQKLMEAVESFIHRTYGFHFLVYLDDFLIGGNSIEETKWKLRTIRKVLMELNLHLNVEKSILTPRERIEYLGWEINTRTNKWGRTREKWSKFKKLVKGSLQGNLTETILSKICGQMQFANHANKFYNAFKVNLEQWKTKIGDHERELRRDLQEILRLPRPEGLIRKPAAQLVLHSDGAREERFSSVAFAGQFRSGKGFVWTKQVKDDKIFVLEGAAAVSAMKTARLMTNAFKIFVDNTAVIGALKKGHTRIQWLNSQFKRLAVWFNSTHWKVQYVRSEDNLADGLSRVFEKRGFARTHVPTCMDLGRKIPRPIFAKTSKSLTRLLHETFTIARLI